MLIKTLLNKVERFKPFVNVSISFAIIGTMKAFVVDIEPNRTVGRSARCMRKVAHHIYPTSLSVMRETMTTRLEHKSSTDEINGDLITMSTVFQISNPDSVEYAPDIQPQLPSESGETSHE